jgi:hypothetical protein
MFEVGRGTRGGAVLFQRFHILKALWLLSEVKSIGRGELSRKLGIGEGSTRGLLAHLDSEGAIHITKQGIGLTEMGEGFVESMGLRASEVHAGSLTVGPVDFAIRLSGVGHEVRHGIEQRDEAIKAGADGATTLLYINDELRLPDGFDVEGAEPEAARELKAKLEPYEGDVIVIGTSSDIELARDGAFAAAVLTLGGEKTRKGKG